VPFEVEKYDKLMGHADENMADFVRGMRSEVSCDCDTAAAWKEGLENGKRESCREKRSEIYEKARKERTHR
jgi:hypothetical protein